MTTILPSASTPVQLSSTMNLFGALNSGTAGLVNPLTTLATSTTGQAKSTSAQIGFQTANMDPSDPNFPVLRNLQTALDDSTTQIGALNDHAQSLIFGDTNGTVISGGLPSNLGQAISAVNLNNSMAAYGQTPLGSTSPTDPCALFQDLFGSILGDGLGLINQISTAINQALAPLGQLINQINTAITTGMDALRTAINTAVSTIRTAIQSIASMITNELNAFASWLTAQLNFNLSSFLSGTFNNQCAKLVINAVANPAMLAVLAKAATGSAATTRPAIGGMW